MLAKSILAALANLQPTEGVGISATPLQPTVSDACVLVGYVSGKTYLCFRLKDKKSLDLGTPIYDKRGYAPLFTTLAKATRNQT